FLLHQADFETALALGVTARAALGLHTAAIVLGLAFAGTTGGLGHGYTRRLNRQFRYGRRGTRGRPDGRRVVAPGHARQAEVGDERHADDVAAPEHEAPSSFVASRHSDLGPPADRTAGRRCAAHGRRSKSGFDG